MADMGQVPSDLLLGSHFLGPGPGFTFSSLQQAPGVYLVKKKTTGHRMVSLMLKPMI